MAATLDSVHGGCQAGVSSVQACSAGPPFDAFDARWAKWHDSQGYFEVTKECCLGMADALEKYAKAMDDAVAKLTELVAIAATILVGGLVLTFFTAGLSDAAAGAAVAAIVGEAAVEAGTMAAVIADIGATVFFSAAFGFLEGLAIDSVVQLERIEVFHDQQSWNWGEFWQSGGMGALGGAAGGGMGAGLTRLGGRFAPGLLTGTTSASKGARVLLGVGAGGTSATLVDLAFTGRVNPLDVALGAAGGGLGGSTRSGWGWRPRFDGRGTDVVPAEPAVPVGPAARSDLAAKLAARKIDNLRRSTQSIIDQKGYPPIDSTTQARIDAEAANHGVDPQRFEALARDPDHANHVTDNSIGEAKTVLTAEQQGIITNPMRDANGGDYLGGNGQAWDVKTPHSGRSFDAGYEADKIVSEVADKNEYVLVNADFLNATDEAALRAALVARGYDPATVFFIHN